MTHPGGTKGETALVRYARNHGFGAADRLTKTGRHDRGDVQLAPGCMAQVKCVKVASKRGPTPALLTEWMTQTRVQTMNGRHDFGFLVVKREGTTDVGRWFAFLEVRHLVELVDSYADRDTADNTERNVAYWRPVCMDVADFLPILRHAGWGDQP